MHFQLQKTWRFAQGCAFDDLFQTTWYIFDHKQQNGVSHEIVGTE